MRWTSLAVLAGLAATGSATTDSSGAVLDLVKPSAENPDGCEGSYNGEFQIEVEPLVKEAETSDQVSMIIRISCPKANSRLRPLRGDQPAAKAPWS